MQYFLILLLSILSTVKISFQSAFSKKSVKNKADILVFNFLVFLFSGILFSVGIVNSSPAVYGYAFFWCTIYSAVPTDIYRSSLYGKRFPDSVDC